jgi:hypothetical protein
MPPGIGYGPMDPMDTAQAPLSMRMMEHMPGVTASLMFAQGRGANTILAGGGYMDFEKSSARRAARHRILDERGRLTERNARQFSFGSKRAAEAAKMGDGVPKMNFLGSSRLNHLTARPRAARRFHSLSVFSNTNVTGAYSPFQAFLGLGRFEKTQRMMQGFVGDAHVVGPTTMGPGLLSAISAGRRMDVLENRAIRGGKISPRMSRKLEKFDRSIDALAEMNLGTKVEKVGGIRQAAYSPRPNLGVGAPYQGIKYVSGAEQLRQSPARAGFIGQGASFAALDANRSLANVGLRGDVLVSVLPGQTTRYLGGYMRTAAGKGAGVFGDALDGRKKALDAIKQVLPAGATDDMAEKFLMSKLRGGDGIRAGMKAHDVTVKAIAQNTAARNVMLTRGAGIALRTANVLGTASLAYDLGKMAGEVVVSGINLARDAYKSVQGSINKPAFGMGYQDTEAAATSRARGVMAIQNSRLNARSVLGSEAGMMAAHFG